MTAAEWWPWVLLAAAGMAALAALLYRRVELRPGWRVILVALRGGAFTLLALFIADTACEVERPAPRPTAAILLDDTPSMSLAAPDGRTRLDAALETAAALQEAHPELDWLTVKQSEMDGWELTEGLAALGTRRPDLAAVVAVSDGTAPASRLTPLPWPVSAWTAGEPSRFDLELGRPRSPRLALVGKPLTVEVPLAARGAVPDGEVEVSAIARPVDDPGGAAGGEIELGTRRLAPVDGQATTDFTFTPPRAGWWLVEFSVAAPPGEATDLNNLRRLLVPVREGELRALVLTGEVGPESAYLHRALERLPGVTAELDWRRPDGRWQDPDGRTVSPDTLGPDAVFLVDLVPDAALAAALARRTEAGVGLGVLLGRPGLSIPASDPLWRLLGLRPVSTTLRLEAGQSRPAAAASAPFTELPLDRLPALSTYPDGLDPSSAALTFVNPGGRRTPGAYLSTGGAPRALLFGRGWWRWQYSDVDGADSPFERLVADLLAFLTTPTLADGPRLTLARRSLTSGGELTFELTGAPDVPTLRLLDDAGRPLAELTASPAGEGHRRGSWTAGEPGLYLLEATVGGRTVHEPLIVEPPYGEFTALAPDSSALADLASATGGELLTRPDDALPLSSGGDTRRLAARPWHSSPWFLALALALLLGEWFLRRRLGLR